MPVSEQAFKAALFIVLGILFLLFISILLLPDNEEKE